MSFLMPNLFLTRRRKWLGIALAMTTLAGCIRFRSDAPADAGPDGSVDPGIDADLPPEGGDVIVIPPPVCETLDPNVAPNVADKIAVDLITQVTVTDCRLRRHFTHLPPIALTHFHECLTAQIGQVMGCLQPDGAPFRYPTLDSNGKLCRDMKSSHLMLALSDGDFEAFLSDMDLALEANGLTEEQRKRVLMVFGATRNDIALVKDAGPTKPCDAGNANPDAD